MGLSLSLGTAISGLQATQVGISVVSQNVAGAKTAGYIRRSISTSETLASGTSSVSSTQVQRLLDQIVQRQLWEESAGAAYTGMRVASLASLDQLYGSPGSGNAFDAVYSSFTSSLQALQNDPSSYTNRTAVLDAATELATRLNGLSDGVQTLRTQAETGIANAVVDVNQLLAQLSKINSKVVQGGTGSAAAELKDQRDRVLSNLSQYIDIRTTESSLGSVSVFTSSGQQIFDGTPAVTFGFDQRSTLTADSQWTASAATRSVGTITLTDGSGNVTDAIANKTFRSGTIAAYVDLRDNTLVQAQAQLDEIAAHLASALSDREVDGVVTSAAPASEVNLDFDLSALQRGNSVTLDYKATPSGGQQRFTFVNVASGTTIPASATGDASNRVIGIDFSAGAASIATQIQTAIGASGFTVSNPSGQILRIADDGAGATRDVLGLTARPTSTTLSSVGGAAELPFFVDGGRGGAAYTGSFEGVQQFTGFAARIAINPDLVKDRSKLVTYTASTAQGDATRPRLLLARLNTSVQSFTRAIGVDGSTATSTATVSNYVQRVVASQGQSFEAAQRLDEGQKVAFSAVQGRFNESSQVNVDQEMSLLIELQSAYAANARVISTVKEMMDVLLRI